MPGARRPPAHPDAEVLPLLDDGALAELAADIKAHGLRHPIVLHDGMILDGRNRWAACEIAGVEPVTVKWDGKGDPLDFVLSENLHRRHLNESQRAMVAARARERLDAREDSKSARDKADRGANLHPRGDSAARAGRAAKVSERSVKTASKVLHGADPALIKAVDAGKVPVSTAAKLADAPKDKQRAAAAGGKKVAKQLADEHKPAPRRAERACDSCPATIASHLIHCKACNEHTNGAKAKCEACGSDPRAEVARDGAGRAIPQRLVPVLAAWRRRLPAMRQLLVAALGEWQAALEEVGRAMGPDGEATHPINARVATCANDLQRLVEAIGTSLPFAVCPCCHGSGDACTACRKAGWLTKDAFERLPARVRGEIASAP